MADTWGENDKPAPTESWGTGDKEVRQDPPARGLKGWVGDAAATAIRGAIGVPEAIVGLADIPTGGAVGQFLENKDGAVGFRPKQAREAVSEMLDSDATKQQNADFQAADGFIEKAKVAIQNPSMIARGIGESAPSMFAGGLAARGIQALAKVGPVVAGALGEGVVAGGSAAEQIRQETEDGRLTPTQAALAGVTGLATTVLGVGGGALARRFGVGDVDTLLAQGTKGAARQGFDDAAAAAANPLLAQQAKSIPRSVIEGAVSEGLLEELPQSLAEQLLQNLALDKPWDTDLDSAAVMGILTGGAMGGGAGAYSALTRPTITPGQDMPAPAAEQTTPEMLALPAPVIDVGADGTARTADDRTARLKRIATGDVTDITPVPTRSEAMGLDPAAGTLSAAAALAVDTGVTGTMQESVRAQQEQTDLQAAAQEVQKNRAETPVIDYADLNELDRRFVDSYFDQLDKDTDKFLSMAMEDDDGIPDFGDPSNVSDEDFLRSMGANDQEIQDAIQVASRARSTQEGVGSNAAVAFNDASGTQEGARQAQTPAAQGQASFQVGQKWGKPGRDAYTIEKISEDGKLGFADFGGGDKAWVSFGAESANGWGPLNDQPQGASNGPQADQAQQGSAQQAQGRAAQEPAGAAQGEPQPAGPAAGAAIDGAPAVRALTDGATTANDGAQAAPAPGAQGAPDSGRRATAGAAWTRMPTTERQALANRLADQLPNVAQRKNLHRLSWDTMNGDLQRKITDAISPANVAPALTQQAQSAIKTEAQQIAEAVSKADRLDLKGSERAQWVADSLATAFGMTTDEVREIPEVVAALRKKPSKDDATAATVRAVDQVISQAQAASKLSDDAQGKAWKTWEEATPAQREAILLAAGWKPGSPATTTLKGQDWSVFNAAQRRRLVAGMQQEQSAPGVALVGESQLGVEAGARQVRSGRLVADAEVLPNLAAVEAAVEKGGRGSKIELPGSVNGLMLSIGQDSKIRQAVVELIPVDVMNVLRGQKITPEMLFNDPSMLVDLAGRGGDTPVPGAVDAARAFVQAAARAAAEAPGTFEFGGATADFDAALNTIEGRQGVTPTSNAGPDAPGGGTPGASPIVGTTKPAGKAPSAAQVRAKADFMNAMADLGDIFGKNFRATMLPEQEQKLLPVLTRLIDAAFRMGYHKFKNAAKFSLDQIRANLGDEAADALTLDHLQGAYIASGPGKGKDTKRTVIDVETKAEIEAHEAVAEDDATEAPAPVAEVSGKERWLKSVSDMNRMSGQFGAQIDGIANGRLSIVGNPNATKQGKALMGAVDEARRAGATTEEIAAAATSKVSEAEKPTGATLRDALLAEITANRMPKDNPALKKLVEAYDGQPATPARMKEAQEALEAAIVLRARETVAKLNREGTKTTFAALRRLYDSQPLLNVRTSTSIENQAYSTPAPLAYLASRLAGINANTTVLEPTAGNGMLLIGAAPSKAIANELQPARAAELREQGFAKVTERDATERVTPLTVDAVITNPPFGSIKGADGKTTKVKVDGYSLGQIDHLIAARALEAMKDDGKAVLILGANKVPGGISNDDLVFFNWLYSHYDVRSHFEADGKLYQRQGAGWPVRVITIDGRKESKNVSPAPGTVPRVSTWEEVYDQFENGMAASRPAQPGAAESAGRANGIEAERLTTQDPAGAAPAGVGGREPAGSPAGPGAVAGASHGVLGNRAEREPAAPGASAGQQRFVQPPAVAGGLDENRLRAGQPARSIAVGDPGNGGVADNEFQVAYVARSDRKDEGVLIPRNMADPTQAGLNRLEDAVGGIDEFAAKELGYKNTAELHQALMGLQIDSVASAIQQIKGGKGTIIADQTGIGKGRQAAAIIRWAVKNGKTPVFVTQKPSLFTDMFGDLADIGTDDVAPFIMNVDESIKGPGGEKLFANKAALHRGILKRIADSGAMPDGRNAVFMTYSQINLPNAQRQAIEALAPNAVFVLDESHTAGGDSATGNFIRGVLDQGQGVVYLSATYAKRPDNMPVYFKTDIGEAVADDASLMDAMAAGGLPLQTVVANNLVKAGQMFRRERSYDGVNIANVVDTPNRAAHEKLSDAATSALREIVAADKMFHTVYVKARQEEAKAEGSRAMDTAGNQAGASVNHTEFSSVVHNFVRQMLLGLKAQTAADSAIAKLKAGEKPIIAVENTMGSFLAEYAENNGIRPGSPLGNFDYRTVLSRALERTRYLVIQDQTGDKRKVNVTLAELDGATREAYDRAQATIDALDIDIPVSPIDWMRNQITKAGYSVAEITGRNLSVDYSGKRPMLSVIDQQEQRDKVETTRRFNDGRLDSIILNVAGSTGISLHASEKFADRRKRHMIVAQPAQDINIFMQMLGRIHRTGQVELPGYTSLGVDLPAEKRPMALTADKMKSLNANTSSNTESATSVQAVSLLNKYGDQVVAQYLDSNMELSRQLGIDTPVDSEGQATEEDMARKATGRLALMPVKVQQEFYDEVEEQYRNLINYLNETNQNDLEPRTFDFDARETKQQVIFEGEKPESPFGEDATYGEYSIKAQGKPMTPAEINAAITENLAGQTYQDHANAINKRLQPDLEKYLAKLDDAGKEQAMRQVRDARQFMGSHSIGAMFRVSVGEETYTAVVTNLRSTHKANGNPYAMSKLQVTIALNGSLRSLTVPATQFGKIEVSELGRRNSVESVFAQRGVANERETAKIITGNLLAAYGELRGVRGTIISFTKSDGTSDQGILLPKGFKVEENTQGDYRFRSGEEAYTFLMNGQDKNLSKLGIATRDQQVRVTPVGTAVQIRVPKSKARGAKFFLDKALIEAAGADFVSTATTMNVTVPADRAARALEVLSNKQALYALPSMAAEAKDMATVAPEAPPTDDNGEDFAAKTGARGIGSPTDRAVMGLANAGASTTDILNLIQGTSRNLQNKELARKLVALGINPKVVVGTSLGSGDGYRFIAKYTNSTDTITMSEAARDRAEYTFLHEAVHAATVQALNRKGLASIQMQNLYQHVMAQDAALNHYGMKNVREFVAEAFTNPEFQAALKGINAPRGSTLRNAWDAFVRIVRDILGLKNDDPTPGKSVLDEVMAAGASLMRENAESTGRGNAEADIAFAGQAQTDSPEFKRWFKDSKVVGADGQPLRVFHGTGRDFSVFDTRAANVTQANGNKTGTWGAYFTPSPAEASTYAEMSGGAQAVVPVYLSIQNPYVMNRAEWRRETMAANKDGREVADATRARIEAAGHDGIVIRDRGFNDEWVAFEPNQVKSAVGNRGTFDPADDDISYFGLPELRTLKATGLNELQQTLTHAGKVSVWDKTVGTMRNLAERQPLFRPVFDAAQRFIDDVAMLANDAADFAPRLLPRVESWRDLTKKPISAEDNKAIARPLFEGTLMWARDVDGSAVLVDDLQGKYQNLPTADKAQLLLKAGRLAPQVLRMWQGLPVAQFDSIINAQFNSKMLKPGVVWSDKELSEIFKATPGQISLYREARAGIDRSLDMTSRTDMLRLIGQDYAAMRDAVLEVPTLADARDLITDTLMQDARANPEQTERLTAMNNAVVDRYEKATALMAEGYAPLSRFGRYTVDVVDQAGERQYFGMFESMREANQMAMQMRSTFPGATVTSGTMSAEAYKLFSGVTPESLEQFGGMLGLSTTGSEAKDKAFQAYLQLAKNNHSALKRLIHRKGIAGYSEDVGRVLASFIYSNARLGAGGLNAGTMEAAIQAIPKEQGELRDVALKLRDYTSDPQEEGQAIRGMLFAQYLGGSLASAFVNTTQPFTVTLPYLSQFGGIKKAGASLARAMKDMGTKGFKYDPELANALRHAEDDGVVSPQEIHQLMAQARGAGTLSSGDGTRLGNARAGASNAWERTKVAWGQPFAIAEQFNRRSTFIAAFRLAKQEGMKNPAGFARKAVLETQFLYSKANKPRWARGAIGGTLMTFKTYSISYLELLNRTWNAGEPGSPERAAGRRAVGWSLAMLLLMGGAGGLPFMEDLEDLIDGIGQLMGYNLQSKQWRKQAMRDIVGKEVADFMEQGVSGLPGAPIDVSGRLGMGNLIPGTGLFLTKPNRERDLLEIAGPAGDLVARGFSGARKLLTGDVGGAAMEAAPTAVRNVAKGVDMATSGIYKDTKGYKVIDTTLDEALSKAIGFQPKAVAQVQEANSAMQRARSFYTLSSSDIKAQWAAALFNKDDAALEDVKKRLDTWNRQNPDQVIVVKMPDIWKKVREMNKDRTDRIADTAPKALRQQMRDMAADVNSPT